MPFHLALLQACHFILTAVEPRKVDKYGLRDRKSYLEGRRRQRHVTFRRQCLNNSPPPGLIKHSDSDSDVLNHYQEYPQLRDTNNIFPLTRCFLFFAWSLTLKYLFLSESEMFRWTSISCLCVKNRAGVATLLA